MLTVQAIRMVPDVPEGNLEYVQRKLGSRIDRHPERNQVTDYLDATLYNFGDDKNGWCVLWHPVGKEVLYFVRYKAVKLSGVKFGRQILVYRQPGAKYRGITEKVFFEYLLPRFKALISDQEQTSWGKRMWVYLADEAFSNGLRVSMLDRRGSGAKTTELPDMAALRAASPQIWGGAAEKDRLVLLAISKDTLI